MQQSTTGTSVSPSSYSRTFEYPLRVISSYDAPVGGNVTIVAKMERGKNVQQFNDLAFPNDWKTFDYSRLHSGEPDFLGSNVNNWQNGMTSYLSVPAQKRSYGSGSTRQLFLLSGISDETVAVVQGGTNEGSGEGPKQMSEQLYQRVIVAANDSIVYNNESFGEQGHGRGSFSNTNLRVNNNGLHEFTKKGVKALLGRGPL